jgi:hypothetical protein
LHPEVAAERPGDDTLARSGFFTAAETEDWLDAYDERIGAVPIGRVSSWPWNTGAALNDSAHTAPGDPL